MQLVLTTYGTSLAKRGGSFLIRIDGKNTEVPIVKVESIWIATSAMISTDVIASALEHNIDIVFLDDFGDPIGRVWHVKMGSTAAIRRRQLEVTNDERGLKLVKEWVAAKMKYNEEILKRLKHTRPEQEQALLPAVAEIEKYRTKLLHLGGLIDEQRETILGLEGMAARTYFTAISQILPTEWRFVERSHRPAKDPFNCTLNYAYGVLYSLVERACILSGLDPYVGILHTDNYNKRSFVFDLIEPFRGHADEVVIFLFTKRKMRSDYFDHIEGGYSLNKGGKGALMEALNTHLDGEVEYNGRSLKIRNTILADCHSIANRLLKEV